MEQVFTLVNTVLQSDRETSKRKLNIRGYIIVPLGAQAGILEFVVNTTPMQTWLQNAHLKYDTVYILELLTDWIILQIQQERHDPSKSG